MWKVIKKGLVFCCFIIAFFCTYIISVEAENENTGYAECWYQINKDYYNSKYDSHEYRSLYFKLKVSKVSTISTSCISGQIGGGETGYCNIKSYELNGIISQFHPESKVYQCPDKLYVGGYYEKKNQWFSAIEYKYTKDGLMNLKLSVNKKSGEEGNLYWSTADLKRSFILSEETAEHNADETGEVIIGDISDHKKAEPADTTSGLEDIEGIIRWGNSLHANDVKYEDDACLLIKGPVQEFLNILFIIISVVGIILLVIMSAAEFVRVITGSEEEGIKTAFKHTIIRVVCILILLILPMLVSWLLTVINENFSGDYEIGSNGEPLCEIGE